MVYIIGASSLNNTIKCITYQRRRALFGRSYSIGGLSFNRNARNPLKILQNLLEGRGVLARKSKIVTCHDVISKTITKHRSNNNTASSVEDLLETLRKYRDRIEAIVYTRPEGNIDIFPELLKTPITVLKAQSNLVSHRKSKDTKVLEDLRQIQPSVELEARLLSTTWRNRDDLTRLYKRKKGKKTKTDKEEEREQKQAERPKKKKKSKKERERAKRKQQTLH